MRCSIIIPFNRLDNNAVGFIKSLKGQDGISNVELIFVLGDCYANYSVVKNRLEDMLGSDFILLQDKTGRSGPSSCWCAGLKAAKGDFVSFLATDVIVGKDWLPQLLSKLKTQVKESCLAGNIAGTNRDHYLSIIERAVDQRRFDSVIVDFRNFVGGRELLLNILSKYFDNKYFSDVELDFVLKNKLKMVPIRTPEVIIYNRYPEKMSSSIRRKLMHGIGYGRICKMFIDRFRSIRTFGIYEFLLAIKILCSETWYAELSYGNKTVLAFLNTIFLAGVFLGIVIPSLLTRRYYRFHFDE